MQHLIRSTKSGSDWNIYDLEVFNIVIQNVDTATFFSLPPVELPATTVSPVVLDNAELPQPLDEQITKEERLFFKYLKRADRYEKEAANDFINHVLRMLNFDDYDRMITTGREMILNMCGTPVSAKADIDVFNSRVHSLFVQEEKHSIVNNEPKAPLITAAISAFEENNYFLLQNPRTLWTFYGLTVTGSAPFFYKIPITRDLVDSVSGGEYPTEPMIVQRLEPPVRRQNLYHEEGMMRLENRCIVFQCLEALRNML